MAVQVAMPQKDGDDEKVKGLAMQYGGQALTQLMNKKGGAKPEEKEDKNISAARRQLAKTEEDMKKSNQTSIMGMA
jgi:hypothetical protein